MTFYFRERKIKFPLLDFKLFKNRNFFIGVSLAFLLMQSITANMLLLPFYLQFCGSYSPGFIGTIMLLSPLAIFILSPISGYLADLMEPKKLVSSGLIFIALGIFMQAFFSSEIRIWCVILSQIFIGIGFGLFSSPNNYSMMRALPKTHMSVGNGIASLMRNFGRNCGTVIATAIFAGMNKYFLGNGTTSSYALSHSFAMTLFVAGFFAVIAVGLAIMPAARKDTLKHQQSINYGIDEKISNAHNV
jgi:MFS family permease